MNTQLTLYPAAAEQFKSLSNELQVGWTVHIENFDKFETDKQLQTRLLLADFTAYPDFTDLAKQLMEDPASVQLDDFKEVDPVFQQELYFLMGAKGVHTFVTALLKEVSCDEDIQALAYLTAIRHKLLEMNSHSTHV